MISREEGYTSTWRIFRVDTNTWEDSGEITYVNSISISKDATDDVPLLESGSFEFNFPVSLQELDEGYFRIREEVMQKTSDGFEYENAPIATLLLQSGRGHLERNANVMSITGKSVLQPASDRVIGGSKYRYAPKGCYGGTFVVNLLSGVLICPVKISGGDFKLNEHVVFDPSWSYLRCAWAILDAGDFCMRITGMGEVIIGPKPSEPAFVLDKSSCKNLVQGIDYDISIENVPNVYYVVDGDIKAIVKNDDPDSKTSTVKRGRIIDTWDTNPIRINNETYAQYGIRKLVESSTVVKTYSYTREYIPDILPFDMIRSNLVDLNIFGDYRVLSQQLACGNGISVSETVGMEIKEYSG